MLKFHFARNQKTLVFFFFISIYSLETSQEKAFSVSCTYVVKGKMITHLVSLCNFRSTILIYRLPTQVSNKIDIYQQEKLAPTTFQTFMFSVSYLCSIFLLLLFVLMFSLLPFLFPLPKKKPLSVVVVVLPLLFRKLPERN